MTFSRANSTVAHLMGIGQSSQSSQSVRAANTTLHGMLHPTIMSKIFSIITVYKMSFVLFGRVSQCCDATSILDGIINQLIIINLIQSPNQMIPLILIFGFWCWSKWQRNIVQPYANNCGGPQTSSRPRYKIKSPIKISDLTSDDNQIRNRLKPT